MNSAFLPQALSSTQPLLDFSYLIERDCYQAAETALRQENTKLVYLESPAGYGKTCLMGLLHNRLSESTQCAWLSLSEKENNPNCLLLAISNVLQRTLRGAGKATESLLGISRDIPTEVALSTLLNEIHSIDLSSVLCLDNIELIYSNESLAIIDTLLSKTHPRNKFIFAGRVAPRNSIAMLKGSGLVHYISGDMLRLSYGECEKIVKQHQRIELSTQAIQAVILNSDGWPIALNVYLSAIKKQPKLIELEYSNSIISKEIAEYFDQTIYQQMRASDQRALVQYAQLNIIHSDLCRLLAEDGALSLQCLIENNVFVVQLEDKTKYRFNFIFHEYLNSKGIVLSSEQEQSFYKEAIKWCNENNEYEQAILLSLSIEDWDSAIFAIESCRLDIMTHNKMPSFLDWAARIPEELINNRPKLLLLYGWTYALSRRFEKTEFYINKIKAVYQKTEVLSDYADLDQELEALRCVTTAGLANTQDLAQLVEASKSKKLDVGSTDLENPFYHVYSSSIVYACSYLGKQDTAHRLAVQLDLTDTRSNLLATTFRYIFRGLGYRFNGLLPQAKLQYELAVECAREMIEEPWINFSVPEALLMETHYEWDMLDKARSYSPIQSDLNSESVTVEPIIASYLTFARLASLEGNREEALDILAQGEAFGIRENCRPIIANMLCERLALLARHGDHNSSLGLLEELEMLLNADSLCTEQLIYWSDIKYCCEISKVIIEHETNSIKDSLNILSQLAEMAKNNNRTLELVKITMLEAISYSLSGKQKTAIKKTSQAIALASKGHLIRTFMDLGENSVRLVFETLKHWDSVYEGSQSDIDESYINILKKALAVPDTATVSEYGMVDSIEPLTAKDKTLLRYLGEGLKNKEIAATMSLSENTIAWHLKNLYGKLHASNRTSAVNIARHLRII